MAAREVFDPGHRIEGPPFSAKLTFAFSAAPETSYFGTGFCVEHLGRQWLVTCRHNIEERERDFAGVSDLAHMSISGGPALLLDAERAVVGIRIEGFVPDCAAVELRPGEWPLPVKFETRTTIAFEGDGLPQKVVFRGPVPERHTAELKPTAWVVFQGFPGEETSPVTLQGVRVVPLPTIIQPWMISFLPACAKGFSGGPVLDWTSDRLSLLGVTTHLHSRRFEVTTADGRLAEIEVRASAAVPIRPLLWALERAPRGNNIIDVQPPPPAHR